MVEVKTAKSSLKNPDQVKLASMLKDMLDHALMKGVVDYTPVGILITGSVCKVYKLSMPVSRMYCYTEISSFQLPNDINDAKLKDKIEMLVSSMHQCRQMVDESISCLRIHDMNEQSTTTNDNRVVDSYPSPPQHYAFYQ